MVRAFGELVNKHGVTHSLGGDLLKFMKNPLHQPALLPKTLRTLLKDYDKLQRASANTVEVEPTIKTKC